jgi:hypothetical protein
LFDVLIELLKKLLYDTVIAMATSLNEIHRGAIRHAFLPF